MTQTVEVDHLHWIEFECIHAEHGCGRKQRVEIHDAHGIEVGMVIKPFPGGRANSLRGDWGRCLFCKRPGLRALAAPVQHKKKPVGWNR